MSSLTDSIEEARRLLGEGQDKRAADLLTATAAECRDPYQARMILSLAQQGEQRAGRFGKRRWQEPIRLAEKRLEPAAAPSEP